MPKGDVVEGKARLMFMLNENAETVFKNEPPWQTGFRTKVSNLPMDWGTGDHRFVIINSLTGVVFGPFIQTRPLQYDRNGVLYVRKDQGRRSTYQTRCRHLMEFRSDYQIKRGISWSEAAKILGLKDQWIIYRKTLVGDEAFEALCLRLEALNNGILDIEDYPIYQAQDEDFDCSEVITYEQALAEFYGDDRDLIRAHAESDDRD